MKYILFLFLVVGSVYFGNAQQIDLDDFHWKIQSGKHKILEHKGQKSIMLVDGVAIRNDIDFNNGVLEFDMFYSNEMSFPGIIFRATDDQNYEEFYLRPWLSGNPDATQYSPVYNGFSGWQLYYGASYAKAVELPYDQWVHFKLVIINNLMDIFIGDMDEPAYTVELKREFVGGKLGFKNAFAPAYFANLKVTETDNAKIKGIPEPEKASEEGTVHNWQISSAFPESVLDDSTSLPNNYASQVFKTVPAEKTGILNIAEYTKRKSGDNSVYLKIEAWSNQDQIVPFAFGFSDRIRVYLNGDLLYYASDVWQARDYKFLGTIGLHDMLFLPLKRGENDIVLAVSEFFGGWGVMGRFPSMSNITIQ